MTELIGVTTIPRNFKKRLLVFDRIAFPNARLWKGVRTTDPGEDTGAADIEWLLDHSIVFDPYPEIQGRAKSLPLFHELFSPRTFMTYTPKPSDLNHPERWKEMLKASDRGARQLSTWLRAANFSNVVPITSGWEPFDDKRKAEAVKSIERAEVVALVIRNLPLPSEHHSFEDILAFRDEARSEGLIQGLRVWINEMSAGKLTHVEVSDKLADLVSRYERMLKLEKMSRDIGVVETLVTTTAEVAESLVKFQWSNIAKKLFEVRHKQIDLMKAEITLPGREVAYIVKARGRFDQ